MNVTHNESSFENQSETSIFMDSWHYMALTSIVECESEKSDGKIENLEQTESSQEESNSEKDLR